MRAASLSSVVVALAVLVAGVAAAAEGAETERGRALFLKHCAGCHGPKGRGAARTFMPHVNTLTKRGYIDLLPDEYLVQVIAKGGPEVGKSSYMPAWESVLSHGDIRDLVSYIRSLRLY